MANSSEWLGALAASPSPAPDWLALIGEAGEFREALPFGTSASASASAPNAHSAPAPDALALAYAEGEAAGRTAALAEAQRDAAQQRALRLAFRSLDEAALEVLSQDLAETVIALCDGVLADHATNCDKLIARCRTAAARIGGAAVALRLHLHPDDIEQLGPDALADWTVIADSALERGALLLEGPDGAVREGPADWRRTIADAVRG